MTIARVRMAAYGAFALPLAFAGLPLYVFAPKFYADHFGLSLSLLGTLLIFCRLLDAVQDPVFGYLSEHYLPTPRAQKKAIGFSALLMAGAFFLLFHPLVGEEAAAWWFVGALVLTFSAYSFALINYLSLGAALTRDYHAQTALSGWREALGLVGVLAASILPVALSAPLGERGAFDAMSAVLFALVIITAALLFRLRNENSVVATAPRRFLPMLRACSGNKAFLKLIAVYFMSAVAAAIPATLVLFYVDQVLGAASYAGLFLAVYFVAAALSMPLWNRLVRRVGKKNSWLFAMLLAVISFVWAYFLGSGDVWPFVVVCMISGVAFGADLSIPPAMLTDTLAQDEGASAYFGLWAFTAKLALAVASGIGLVLMDVGGVFTLAFVYAFVPCVIKLVSAALLWQCVSDKRGEKNA